MSTTFVALAHEPRRSCASRACSSACAARRCRPAPTSAALAAHAVTNAAIQLAIVIVAGALLFGVGWPQDWLALAVFAAAGVDLLRARSASRSSHAIPNFDSAPAYVNAIFLPLIVISGVFYDADEAPAFLRDIAEALPLTHLIDGLSGAMVTGAAFADHLSDLVVVAPLGRAGACSPCAGSAGRRAAAERPWLRAGSGVERLDARTTTAASRLALRCWPWNAWRERSGRTAQAGADRAPRPRGPNSATRSARSAARRAPAWMPLEAP